MHQDKLSKIQQAALEVFTERGYLEAKISEIAAKAGVSAGTIYNYYKSKKALFDSLNIPELESLRPEYDQKKQEILKVALMQLGQKGYARTTMDDIAGQLGISKAALYQYFNSKEEIFLSTVQESDIHSLISGLNQSKSSAESNFSIEEIGYEFLGMYGEPEKLSLLRAIISESAHFPEIGRLVFERTIDDANNQVAEYIKKMRDIRDINPKFAARAFLGMLLSFVVVDKLINPSENEFSQEEIVSGVVDIFLNGLKTKGRDE